MINVPCETLPCLCSDFEMYHFLLFSNAFDTVLFSLTLCQKQLAVFNLPFSFAKQPSPEKFSITCSFSTLACEKCPENIFVSFCIVYNLLDLSLISPPLFPSFLLATLSDKSTDCAYISISTLSAGYQP